MKIGLFGGLFDPVHVGHAAIAQHALKGLSLDRLYIIPANDPPHKPQPALPAQARSALLRAAFESDPRMEVSTVEIERGGLSFAYETAEHFKARVKGELFFIIGGDNLAQIGRWKNPERIFAAATVAAVGRPGFEGLEAHPALREKVQWVEMPPVDISSTRLRELLKQGLPVEKWIPGPALKMIREKGWYR